MKRDLMRVVVLLILVAFGTSPAWATDPVNCNTTFTACSIPENVILRLPFLAIAGDVIIQDANSSVSDVFRVFNNISDTGEGTGLGTLVVLYSRDNNPGLPDPSTYSANAVIIKESASGSTSYLENGTTYNLDTAAVATQLKYTGDTAADYHDPAQLSAVLTVLATGTPVPNAKVNFTLGSQSCSATTNAAGAASCSLVLNQIPANSAVSASFSGLFGSDAGASSSNPFNIMLEATTLSYTGDTVIANGGTAHLSGVLLEDNLTPIAGRTVSLTLGTDGSAQTCKGVTDATGKVACSISPVSQPLGPGVVSASFGGDAFYRPSSAGANSLLFAFLTSGSFVLGDQNAQVGTDQTFWGAQWAKNNLLSGGAAPAAFKGFAESLSSQPPACGASWTSRTGNSSAPPGAVPAYMGVLVSPAVSKSGSAVVGSGVSIVVVQIDAGYAPDPGARGTGVVVAQYCHQ